MLELLSEVELSYLAGFFDGEGSITIARRNKKSKVGSKVWIQYQPRIAITSTSKDILGLFIKSFAIGEKLYYTGPNKYAKNTKARWVWEANGTKAMSIIECLLPYLRVKRAEAKVFLRFKELISQSGVWISQDNREKRKALLEELQLLK
jgi:LAGLIDADG endonuclease